MDVLDLELFRHVTGAVLDEIEINLTRTAYSPLIYEYKDYTVGILDADFQLMTQSKGSLPVFLSDLGEPVRDAVKIIGVSNLAPGDVFITNYAAVQGQHLNNVVAATPIIIENSLLAYIAIRAHWADLGGVQAGGMSWLAREIYHEGTQYRGLLVMRSGKIVPEIVATILANTRMEEHVRGDLMAQLGGCLLGCRRWEERIASKWDANEVQELWRLQRKQSTEIARQRIAELPDGLYEAHCWLDDAGEPGTNPLLLEVKVLIEDTEMTIDFTELPPQVAAPINSGANGGAVSIARVAYKMLIAPDYPADQGLFEPLQVKLAEGTLLTARKGAAMGHWNSPLPSIIDLILRAIGERCPDLVPAGHHSSMGVFIFDGKNQDGDVWLSVDTAGGGWGGSSGADGFSPIKTMLHGDNKDIPVEIVEARFPLRVLKYSFIPGSAGRGTFRGGFGVERIIEVTEDVFFNSSMDRTMDPPWGLAGGEPGEPGTIEIRRPGENDWQDARKVSIHLSKGSLVRVRSSGGGGWGQPENRAEDAKAQDILAGLIVES